MNKPFTLSVFLSSTLPHGSLLLCDGLELHVVMEGNLTYRSRSSSVTRAEVNSVLLLNLSRLLSETGVAETPRWTLK